MKRALVVGLLLGAFAAFADRVISTTYSTAQSTVDGAACSRQLSDGGFVATAFGTSRLSSGVARDPDTLPDGGPYSNADSVEVGPVSNCVSNMTTLFNNWKANRGL